MISAGEVPIKGATGNCWERGNVCNDRDDYPICVGTQNEGGPLYGMQQGYFGMENIPPNARAKIFTPGTKFKDVQGVCRGALPKPQADGTQDYDYFFYRSFIGVAGALAIFNPIEPQISYQYERQGFEMTIGEMKALIEAAGLGSEDFKIASRKDPSKFITAARIPANMMQKTAAYLFVLDHGRLTAIIDRLKAGDVKGMASDKKAALIDHLTALREKTLEVLQKMAEKRAAVEAEKARTLQTEEGEKTRQQIAAEGEKGRKSMEDISSTNLSLMIYSSVMTTLFIAIVGWPTFKSMYKKATGKEIKFDDYAKHIRNILKDMPDFEMTGRMEEAKEAWRRTDTPGFRSVIFDLPTREGKDATVDAMIVLKENGDPSVPKDLRNAPVVKVNAAEFHSDTMYRGTVADKVAKIRKLASRGPVIIYIPEIDIVFLGGGTSSGDTESVAKLMLDVLEDPLVKKNLVILGTTSRGGRYTPRSGDRPDGMKTMIETYPDLQGRFNWVNLHKYSLSEMIEILNVDRSPVRRKYELYFGVKITGEMMEAAVRLAEYYHRGTNPTLARFPAFQDVMENACRIARDTGATEVSIDHIREATSEIIKQTIDPARVQTVLTMPLEQIEIPLWDGTKKGLQEVVTSAKTRGVQTESANAAAADEAASDLSAADAEAMEMVEQLRSDPTFGAKFAGATDAEMMKFAGELDAHWRALGSNLRAQDFHRMQSRGQFVGNGIPITFANEVWNSTFAVDPFSQMFDQAQDALLGIKKSLAEAVDFASRAADAAGAAVRTAAERIAEFDAMMEKAYPEFRDLPPDYQSEFIERLDQIYRNETLRAAYFPDGKFSEDGIRRVAAMLKPERQVVIDILKERPANRDLSKRELEEKADGMVDRWRQTGPAERSAQFGGAIGESFVDHCEGRPAGARADSTARHDFPEDGRTKPDRDPRDGAEGRKKPGEADKPKVRGPMDPLKGR